MTVSPINIHVCRASDLKLSAFESRFLRLRNSKSKHITPKLIALTVLNIGDGIMLGTSMIPMNDMMINHLWLCFFDNTPIVLLIFIWIL